MDIPRFKHKILSHPNGKKYYILAGKPIEGSNISIYLLSNTEKEGDYLLCNIEYMGDGDFDLWPYKGNNEIELTKELLEEFIETAYEVL